MAIRPGQIRYLAKGKAIGAKSLAGFVDTFNWMLSWIYNFKVGQGLKIEGERAGSPRLSLTLMNDDGVPVDDGGEDTPYEMTGKGGAPSATIPGPFQPVHDATTGLLTGFTNCIYCAERQFVECGTGGAMSISGVTASDNGYVVLTLPHETSSSASGPTVIDNANVSIAIEPSLPMNAYATETKIPLYHVTAGVVDVDLRAVPTGVLAR